MAEVHDLLKTLPPVAEVVDDGTGLAARLETADEPFVVRGLARDWPLVRAGLAGSAAARTYLLAKARDRRFAVSIGRPGAERVFYDAAMGFDFRDAQMPLGEALDLIAAHEGAPDAPLVYLASVNIEAYFDGLAADNPFPLGGRPSRDGAWIGGRTRIAAHNDVARNLAVCAVGRRRFTLFPPDQFANLYLGPLLHSPGGRPVSMVDFAAPDLKAYPRFRQALAVGQVAELDPGDALFIPSLWFHHVEGLAGFNVLLNAWWNSEPAYLGHPEDALLHAILAIRDLPATDRAHWRALFDHHVFSPGPERLAHVPAAGHGLLAPLDAAGAQRLRHHLLRRLGQ